jgi:hypothetical protein
MIDPLGLVSAGQMGTGNPGSYGGENSCESMYDDRELFKITDNVYVEMKFGEIPIGPGRLKDIARIATGKNIRKLQELIKRWGGRGKDWRKMKGKDAQGREWHWYQKRGDGTKHGLKQKGKPDPF